MSDSMAMDTESIRDSMTRLHAYQEEEGRNIKKLTSVSNGLSLLLAVVLIGFITAIISTLANNFSQPRIAASVQKHVPEMLPVVVNGAVQVTTRVYPTYADLVQKEAVDALPEVSSKLEGEVNTLVEHVEKNANERFHKALLTAFTGPGKPLRKAFPKLKDVDVDNAVTTLTKDVDQDLTDIANQFMLAHIGEIIQLQKTLNGIDISKLPNDDSILSKRLIHDLLLLLDNQVMEGGKNSGL